MENKLLLLFSSCVVCVIVTTWGEATVCKGLNIDFVGRGGRSDLKGFKKQQISNKKWLEKRKTFVSFSLIANKRLKQQTFILRTMLNAIKLTNHV